MIKVGDELIIRCSGKKCVVKSIHINKVIKSIQINKNKETDYEWMSVSSCKISVLSGVENVYFSLLDGTWGYPYEFKQALPTIKVICK